MSASLAWARQTIGAWSLPQLVGQLLLPYVSGPGSDAAHPENLRRFGVSTPAEAVQAHALGGVMYFAWSDNVQTIEQVAALSRGLQRASAVPLTISIDQETGSVARITSGLTEFPGAMALGAAGDPALTFEVHEVLGRELSALGITTDYAPVADVNVSPDNPVIGIRSFGADPEAAAGNVAAAVAGLQASGVSATAKHFPGHGDTTVDSHRALPVVTHTRAEWERVDAPPFRAAIAAGVDAIMTGHLSFPELDPSGEPASLSPVLTTGLLRAELGFTGLVVTDSLRMAGVKERYDEGEVAVRALVAGADVLLDPELPREVLAAVSAAVASGRLSRDRLEQSAERILTLKHRRGLAESAEGPAGSGREPAGSGREPAGSGPEARSVEWVPQSAEWVPRSAEWVNGPSEGLFGAPEVGTAADRDRAQQITDRSVTVLRDDDGLVPLPAGTLLVTGWGDVAVPLLADALARTARATTAHHTGGRPDGGSIASAVALARRHDLVLVLTGDVRTDAGQRALVAELLGTGRPVVVAALRDPYGLAGLDQVRTCLLTYSTTPVALRSLARVLDGTVRARGRLP